MTAAQNAFQTLGINDGLRSNSVTSLLADSRGYLWIGTYQGLNRYDGHQVKTRFPESSDPQFFDGRSGRAERHEVFAETITALEEDAEGRIWIESESGAYCIYDTRTARFQASPETYLRTLGIHLKGKYKVKVGQKGALWVLTEEGIFHYDFHTKELKTWEKRLQLPGKKLMAITGQGPAEFIRTIRIKRGRALLETSQMQITEIAYAVGFTTVKSFTMNFKAEYGMTPTEFRNNHE